MEKNEHIVKMQMRQNHGQASEQLALTFCNVTAFLVAFYWLAAQYMRCLHLFDLFTNWGFIMLH